MCRKRNRHTGSSI